MYPTDWPQRLTTLIFVVCLAYIPYTLAAQAPALALAKTYNENIELDQYWVSEKLDGIRAYWDGKQLISRQGHIIHAPTWFTALLPTQTLDGELWSGRGQFERTTSIVRKHKPIDKGWRDIRYMVFDLPASKQVFTQRLQQLRQLLNNPESPAQLIPQIKITDQATLDAELQRIVLAGGEGLMLHHGEALYRAGRSNDLIKLKPYYDAEATVIGYRAGKGKYRGQMGSLQVETAAGIQFYIGSGFSDQQRKAPPPLGTIISYRYYGLTHNGIPRHSSFIRQRFDHDL
ncbi:MAG: DNA ligase [Spongiibacteraceae bacterium]